MCSARPPPPGKANSCGICFFLSVSTPLDSIQAPAIGTLTWLPIKLRPPPLALRRFIPPLAVAHHHHHVPKSPARALTTAPPPRPPACLHRPATALAAAASTSLAAPERIWLRTAARHARPARRLRQRSTRLRGVHQRPHRPAGLSDGQERHECRPGVRRAECRQRPSASTSPPQVLTSTSLAASSASAPSNTTST